MRCKLWLKMMREGQYKPPHLMPRRLIAHHSNAVFHAAEAARLALMKTCKMLETPEQPSTLAKIGFSRKPAKAAANAAVQGRVADGFVQLRDYINGLESVWKSRQGRVRLVATHIQSGCTHYVC